MGDDHTPLRKQGLHVFFAQEDGKFYVRKDESSQIAAGPYDTEEEAQEAANRMIRAYQSRRHSMHKFAEDIDEWGIGDIVEHEEDGDLGEIRETDPGAGCKILWSDSIDPGDEVYYDFGDEPPIRNLDNKKRAKLAAGGVEITPEPEDEITPFLNTVEEDMPFEDQVDNELETGDRVEDLITGEEGTVVDPELGTIDQDDAESPANVLDPDTLVPINGAINPIFHGESITSAMLNNMFDDVRSEVSFEANEQYKMAFNFHPVLGTGNMDEAWTPSGTVGPYDEDATYDDTNDGTKTPFNGEDELGDNAQGGDDVGGQEDWSRIGGIYPAQDQAPGDIADELVTDEEIHNADWIANTESPGNLPYFQTGVSGDFDYFKKAYEQKMGLDPGDMVKLDPLLDESDYEEMDEVDPVEDAPGTGVLLESDGDEVTVDFHPTSVEDPATTEIPIENVVPDESYPEIDLDKRLDVAPGSDDEGKAVLSNLQRRVRLGKQACDECEEHDDGWYNALGEGPFQTEEQAESAEKKKTAKLGNIEVGDAVYPIAGTYNSGGRGIVEGITEEGTDIVYIVNFTDGVRTMSETDGEKATYVEDELDKEMTEGYSEYYNEAA